MRHLLIGDLHLKVSNLQQVKQLLNWINVIASREDIDAVINLGDTYDSHSVVRSEIMGEFREHVDYICSKLNKTYYYIIGNHDQFRPKDATYHALQPFKGIYKNFIVIDEPKTLGDITFVPYISNYSDFPTDTARICIAHEQFIGCDYGYNRPEIGVDADQIEAEIIISGHIHNRQSFGKVHYPGTPYWSSANDVDQVKGLTIFDDEDYSMEFIESPLPKYRSLRLEISEDIGKLHDILKINLNNTDHWVLYVSGPKIELNAYFNSKKFKDLVNDIHINKKVEYTDIKKKSISIKSNSIKDITNDYIDNIYSGCIDKDTLKEEIDRILG